MCQGGGTRAGGGGKFILLMHGRKRRRFDVGEEGWARIGEERLDVLGPTSPLRLCPSKGPLVVIVIFPLSWGWCWSAFCLRWCQTSLSSKKIFAQFAIPNHKTKVNGASTHWTFALSFFSSYTQPDFLWKTTTPFTWLWWNQKEVPIIKSALVQTGHCDHCVF